jgi:polyisoprenoid-binding protein YceI
MIRLIVATSLVLVAVPIYATTYTLDPDHTQGVFRWNHLGFSSPAAQFSQGEGTLEFDQADPTNSSVTVTIPLSSLHTGVPALDDDLKTKKFFDTATFPIATFKSTKVEKGAMTGQLKVTGDLNLHGVTKPVTLAVTIVKVGTNPRTGLPAVGFDATTTLRRSDFGLGAFVPQVGDEIPMRIVSEAVDAKAAAAAKAAAKDAAKK